MAYVRLLSRLGIYCIVSRSRQRHGGALASNISVQQIRMFFQCQSGLLVGCCDVCWWVLSGWFPGRRVDLGDAARRWYLSSRLWPVFLFWVSAFIYLCLTFLGISILCRQCWLYKGLRRPAPFLGHSRNSGAEVRRRSHRWKLGADVRRRKIEGWALLSWHWSVNSANNEKFGHS